MRLYLAFRTKYLYFSGNHLYAMLLYETFPDILMVVIKIFINQNIIINEDIFPRI